MIHYTALYRKANPLSVSSPLPLFVGRHGYREGFKGWKPEMAPLFRWQWPPPLFPPHTDNGQQRQIEHQGRTFNLNLSQKKNLTLLVISVYFGNFRNFMTALNVLRSPRDVALLVNKSARFAGTFPSRASRAARKFERA